MPGVDEKDREILRILRGEGRITLTELGKRVNLSPASVKNRLEKLERLGAIKGYSAVVDHAFLDEFVSAILELYFKEFDDSLRPYLSRLSTMENVEFLYVRTGESQVLMKVNVADTDELRRFIERLKAIFGVNLTFVEATLVLEELKNCWVPFTGERRKGENFPARR
ncbi:Lrp/AsnC family transcriptional regulator [Thermococcus peptonophilus]|uniref:AsnC family transcriptional regulator n=1 Tax=Thermococcus peptonophilus TaxID=53952 RepID=A0A142CTA3_9EURY|nr:Lrp/AsnC family transcriptional regulator [Thermococcus peptonophilus]AMQ18005.1 AsnC family transcriptional regulator [Thermococcus peptonophilus]